MSEEQKPSVGRIVHYVAYGTPGGELVGVCLAAIITEVYCVHGPGIARITQHPTDGVFTYNEHGWCTDVGLCTLNPTGLYFNRAVPYAEPEIVHGRVVHNPGTWHWPEPA